MRIALGLVLTSGTALCACADDAAPVTADAPAIGSDAPDNPEARCLVPASYGNLGTKTGSSIMGPTTLSITIADGPPRDSCFLNLKNGVAAGTYPITGADADASTCSVCTNIVADIVAMQGPTKFYFATSGTVTLSATQPPTGMLTNVAFVEVSVDGTPLNSGCATRIDAMSFGPM